MSIIIMGIAGVLCTTLFLAVLIFGLIIAPDSGIRAPEGVSPVAATSTDPARLRIPSLSIDTAVEFVGLTLRGTMGAPFSYTHVGWWGYGVAPGHMGSAVIDGHVDNGFGLPGVFARLRDIKLGDDVIVETRGGAQLYFTVTGIQVFEQDKAPVDLIFGQSDKARLNLITCEGRWDRAANTYAKRLVVFTELRE